MIDPPESVRPLFVDAGWTPGRAVDLAAKLAESIPLGHPAYDIFRQYAGFKVGSCGEGEECARGDLLFPMEEPVYFAPYLATWESLLSVRLIGVAQTHDSYGELYVDNLGRCFGTNCINHEVYFKGDSFQEAIERILLGRRSRPMLRPDQESVCLYGETFTAGHPSVWKYS